MKLPALAVVILAFGIVLGFALWGSVLEAEAKPPPELRALVASGQLRKGRPIACANLPHCRTAYNWATT